MGKWSRQGRDDGAIIVGRVGVLYRGRLIFRQPGGDPSELRPVFRAGKRKFKPLPYAKIREKRLIFWRGYDILNSEYTKVANIQKMQRDSTDE